jgi:hypothetical protein
MVDDLRGLDPSRKRVWRRFWKMTGIFLLILAGIIFLPWDVPAPNLADLTPAQGSIIPEEENAVFWFQRADALMAKKVVLASGKTIDRYQSCNSLDDQSRPMRDKNGHWVYDQTLMAESVKLYAEAFPFIDKGLACRQSSGTFPFSNALTRLLVIRSRLQMETGQHERAVDSTVQALQCGKWIMMHADQIFVIQYHGYGGGFFAPLNISLNRALQLVKEMELSNEQLLRLDTELAALNDSTLTGILRDRLPYEFQAFQKTCRTRNWIYIHGGFNWGFPDWIPAYGYKQNLTTRKTATIYRDMMSRLGQPWLESSRFYQTKFPAPKNRTEALLLITRFILASCIYLVWPPSCRSHSSACQFRL